MSYYKTGQVHLFHVTLIRGFPKLKFNVHFVFLPTNHKMLALTTLTILGELFECQHGCSNI
jgi:hypothetical protein